MNNAAGTWNGTAPPGAVRPVPVIAVTGRRRRAAGSHDGPAALDRLVVEVYFGGYSERLASAGALPMHLPASVTPGLAISRVDGLVLTGGSDVDPVRYGADRHATSSGVDRARDAFELALLDAALARRVPVLAICRGLQLLNIHLGGTLHADLTGHPRAQDDTHDVFFTAGSRFAELYGPVTSVNSLHHQGIDKLGNDLVPVGVAPDGVIEAVELPDEDVLGVQWHPEQLDRVEPVFPWLVARAALTSGRTRHIGPGIPDTPQTRGGG